MRLAIFSKLTSMLAVLTASGITIAQIAVKIETADGNAMASELISLNDATIEIPNDTLQTEQVRSLHFKNKLADAETFAKIFLNDGSQLNCKSLTISKGIADCQLLTAKTSIPTDDIQYLRIKPFRPNVTDQWRDVLVSERASDQIVVRRKNDVIDYLDGVIGDMTGEHVQFEFDGDRIDVKFERIDGLIYFHKTKRQYPRPVYTVRTTDGSLFAAETLSIKNTASVMTLSGHSIELPIESLHDIALTNRSAIFLSDLESENLVWRPDVPSAIAKDLTKFFQPRRDRGFRARMLSVKVDGSTREFKKGMATLSHSELTYRLAGEYRRFEAIVGIDAGVSPHGEARLEVWADSNKVFDKIVTGTASAIPVSVDLTGAARMRIVVGSGKAVGDGDYLNLCDARLVK